MKPNQVADTLSVANQQLYHVTEPLKATVPVPIMFPSALELRPMDTATWNCNGVKVTGDPTDRDRDGIPVDATYNGKCTWSFSGGGGSASGYWEFKNVRLQDPDDTDPKAGVKASGEVEWGYQSGSDWVRITWHFEKHNVTKSGTTAKLEFQGYWSVSIGTDTYRVNYSLTGTWQPDFSSEPWGKGTINAQGTFSGTGPGCPRGWQLSLELSNVHYSDCGIDRGTVTYKGTGCDGSQCKITAIWSGCGSAQVTGGCQ